MKHLPSTKKIDRDKFMGKWYVMAGRFTLFETEVHNGIELYEWNKKEQRIDISFTYNQGSFNGKLKSIPQKGWIEDTQTNTYWKVSPFWPLKFDYLILDVADDYSWTAVGVPSGKYLWIMARDKNFSKESTQKILDKLEKQKYPINDIVYVPHQ